MLAYPPQNLRNWTVVLRQETRKDGKGNSTLIHRIQTIAKLLRVTQRTDFTFLSKEKTDISTFKKDLDF